MSMAAQSMETRLCRPGTTCPARGRLCWNNTHHKRVPYRLSLPIYIHVVWLHRCMQSCRIGRTNKKMLWVTTSTKPWGSETFHGFTYRYLAHRHLEQGGRLHACSILFSTVRPCTHTGLAYSSIIRQRLEAKFSYISTGSFVA
jgi:hypothetical protein